MLCCAVLYDWECSRRVDAGRPRLALHCWRTNQGHGKRMLTPLGMLICAQESAPLGSKSLALDS